jgi:hypothetical protein
MASASGITCYNHGGFDMKFKVDGRKQDGTIVSSGWTEYFPEGQQRTISLGTLGLEANDSAWPVYDISGGRQNETCDAVTYDSSAGDVTYDVTGTTLSPDCSLQS